MNESGFDNGHVKRAEAGPRSGSASKRAKIRELTAEVPARLQAQFRENPVATIAAVGAGSFVLGALVGSKLGRIALAAAAPHVVERILQGALGDKIAAYAHTFVNERPSRVAAD